MHVKGIHVILALLLTMFALPAAAQVGGWTAEYYNNPELDGQPVVIRNEESPRGSWGTGSPHAGRPGRLLRRALDDQPVAGRRHVPAERAGR